MRKYKYNLCCFINDFPSSQSGPNKSLNLLVKKVFKKKKNIYFFFKSKNFYVNKDNTKQNILEVFQYIKNSRVIYLNGIYSFSHFIIPLIVGIYNGSKLIISPRGMLGKEAFVKSKSKKLFYIFILKFFLKINKKNITYHASSTKEKVDIKNILNCNPKDIEMILNLNNTNTKFVNVNKTVKSAKFFYFSNITSKKNLIYFINAMKLSKIKSKKMSLDIYGKIIEPNYYKKIMLLIKKYNLNIFYKGEISNNKIQQIQKNYHFLAHPSHGENYGHTIVECLSAGTPVIISDNTPWSNYDDNFDGLVHPSMLPDQLSRSLIDLYMLNNTKYQKLKKKSFAYYKKFIQTTEKKNVNLYKKLFFQKLLKNS